MILHCLLNDVSIFTAKADEPLRMYVGSQNSGCLAKDTVCCCFREKKAEMPSRLAIVLSSAAKCTVLKKCSNQNEQQDAESAFLLSNGSSYDIQIALPLRVA